MNILVIDKSIVWGRLTIDNISLLKHLEYWYEGNNQVDLLARSGDAVLKKLKGKLNFIKIPQILCFLSLISSYFYLIFKARKYDHVIEVWRNKPTFLFNRRRSLIAIFGRDFNLLLPGKVIWIIYRKSRFLVNSASVKSKLQKIGFKFENIKLINDGIQNQNGKKPSSSGKKKNKILIICGKEVKNAISIISLIERRSLEWKFVVLANKKDVIKLKRLYREADLTSSMKAITLLRSVFDTNIADSKFLLITRDVKRISDYVSSAFLEATPVILEGGKRDVVDKKVRNLVLSYDNQIDVAAKILSLSKNEVDYQKLQSNISKSSRSLTWDEVGELSRRYLESL